MDTKTDAAVLIDLIEDLREKKPSTHTLVAYQALQGYNSSIGNGFDIIRTVFESCGRMHSYVELLPRLKQGNKSSFHAAIKNFESAFSLGNMGTRWDEFLNNLMQPVHIQALNFLDHLVSAQDFWVHRRIEPSDAEELIADLESFIKDSTLPDHCRSIILNDLIKMRFIIANIEKFGEQDYWDKFERVTGLFGSMHLSLNEKEQKKAQSLLARLINKINQAVSFSSNATTIAQGVWPLLSNLSD
ncbi:hypothetical protein [Methylorubrum sp. SL192]|uniref:hypothetical protein n=1 Tax=Methylorubrum sp. SL192 TaxID=2995167 RepID=UPI00227412D6|nr:hypothetical protein [Methylorubrum sp. SL192]MCY1644849.1 hypothetical protein [Methylorubrum sp. SL192]